MISWLLKADLSSPKHQLARYIVSNLNWGHVGEVYIEVHNYNTTCFVNVVFEPCYVHGHCKWCILILMWHMSFHASRFFSCFGLPHFCIYLVCFSKTWLNFHTVCLFLQCRGTNTCTCVTTLRV